MSEVKVDHEAARAIIARVRRNDVDECPEGLLFMIGADELAALERALDSAPRWVAVDSGELPEDGQPVLVVFEYEGKRNTTTSIYRKRVHWCPEDLLTGEFGLPVFELPHGFEMTHAVSEYQRTEDCFFDELGLTVVLWQPLPTPPEVK